MGERWGGLYPAFAHLYIHLSAPHFALEALISMETLALDPSIPRAVEYIRGNLKQRSKNMQESGRFKLH